MKRYTGRGLQGPKGGSFCPYGIRYTPPSWLVDTFQDSEALQMLYFGYLYRGFIPSVQFSSVQSASCPTLCNPMNCSMPGLPVHHQLLEFTQTHVHRVGDAIQPSHPLLSPFPPAPNPSQHQSLFQ